MKPMDDRHERSQLIDEHVVAANVNQLVQQNQTQLAMRQCGEQPLGQNDAWPIDAASCRPIFRESK